MCVLSTTKIRFLVLLVAVVRLRSKIHWNVQKPVVHVPKAAYPLLNERSRAFALLIICKFAKFPNVNGGMQTSFVSVNGEKSVNSKRPKENVR